MIGCYIIFSEKLKKFYTGSTQDDLEERIKKHNDGSYGGHRYTSTANDWKLYLFIDTRYYKEAVAIERHIKAMKSSIYIKNLKKYPIMIEGLKAKYQSN